jgi:hypothetical protein
VPPRATSRSAWTCSSPVSAIWRRARPRLPRCSSSTLAGSRRSSPPYAGTYDYAEHQRLRFDFLALRHRDFDDREIGSRRSFEKNPDDASLRWRDALADSIGAIGRALVPGCAAALVIGDSVARNRAIYALDDLRGVLTDDLVMEAWASQHRPMLGGSERRAFGDRPKAEHVVLLRRR